MKFSLWLSVDLYIPPNSYIQLKALAFSFFVSGNRNYTKVSPWKGQHPLSKNKQQQQQQRNPK